ncbi:transcription factor [Fusarium heterosporum]|uniref:Transcription factor n=1 Tax=Fusarium heterosporum TaxID=42747 RepID=A0A8H5TJX9_FUSHE|nr:transcription factor [Fusarium heterosporum]
MDVDEDHKSTRVGYKKSRNGCTRCKKRRVKCDEEVPCSACVRHKVRCSLELSVSESGYQQDRHARSLQPPTNSIAGSSPSSLLSGSLLSNPLDESDCFVSTAELMLHYTTVTYKTMVFSERTVATFQQHIPQLALSYPWFLRQILAFSAYHLAHLRPDKKHYHLLQASKHQNASLRGIREALSEQINSNNCHALYASTTFIVVNKFAAFPNCEDHGSHGCCSPVRSLMEIFSLVNGMEAVIHSPGAADLFTGPLKELFCETPDLHVNSYLFQGLSERLPELARRVSSDYMEDQYRDTLISAVDSITTCVNDSYANLNKPSPPELRVVFWWPMTASRDFLELTLSGHPLALVILAYYNIFLYWGESRYWFFENWAETLLTAIVERVKGSPWEDLLNWPVEVILRRQ